MATRHKDPRHIALGKQGENHAASYLAKQGYILCARNWRGPHGEIDIICNYQGMCIFVEVKTREDRPMNAPHHAMTPRKQKNLIHTASHYLTVHEQWQLPCRFDFIAVTIDTAQQIHIRHTPHVFEAQALSWQPW